MPTTDPENEMTRTSEHDRDAGHGSMAFGMMAMMAVMMAMCMGSALLFTVVPLVGWPLGVAIAAAGVALMLYVHGWMMRHGH